jgi:hypothetical protein
MVELMQAWRIPEALFHEFETHGQSIRRAVQAEERLKEINQTDQ